MNPDNAINSNAENKTVKKQWGAGPELVLISRTDVNVKGAHAYHEAGFVQSSVSNGHKYGKIPGHTGVFNFTSSLAS